MRVDLPAPDDPTKASVRPGSAYWSFSAFSPFLVKVLVTTTGTPGTSV